MTNYLRGAGVDVKKDGNKMYLLPLTDKGVLKLSSGEIKDAGQMLRGKDLSEKAGGLFDPAVTGGHLGKQWAHITLHRKIPSPMYEEAILKLLGLTKAKYTSILQGQDQLNDKTGIDAIIAALAGMDVDAELESTKQTLKTAPPTNVNRLNTKLRYLHALKTLGYKSPDKAYLMKYVPVIPPAFRPVYPLPSGDLAVSDINKHYRQVGLLTQGFKDLNTLGGMSKPDELKYDYDLYNGVKALQGFIDPITYGQEKYKGVIKELAGEQAKFGLIQALA